MNIKRFLLVSLFALLLSACGGGGAEPSAEDAGGQGAGSGSGQSDVTIVGLDNEFDPTKLEVPSDGEVTVEFKNDGETIHTFTSEELGFDTGNVDPGGTSTVTFDAPDGEVEFVCTIHAGTDDMVGTIVPR
jgi:plastocyanin